MKGASAVPDPFSADHRVGDLELGDAAGVKVFGRRLVGVDVQHAGAVTRHRLRVGAGGAGDAHRRDSP